MNEYIDLFVSSFKGYANYLVKEVTTLSWHNYFYALIAASLLFWLWEIIRPWRKEQAKIRRDFWLDGFYMFFNFFLFSLIGYNAVSEVFVKAFRDILGSFGIENLVAIEIASWSKWAQLLALLFIRDFIHFNVHRLLHKVPFLWEFHKVHHSVREMGFAAHLRYHWMETIVYKSIEYIPLAMIGFGIDDFFIVHAFALCIGHFNHANIKLPLGPLKYVLNNPQMHIWHHAKDLPKGFSNGMNFGISFSFWDYLFKTAYIPSDGRDIALGFKELEKFPDDFVHQIGYPFVKNTKINASENT